MYRLILTLFVSIVFVNTLFSDELKMGYLELKESSKNSFDVTLKVPIKAARRLGISVDIPSTCKESSKIETQLSDKAYIDRWSIKCSEEIFDKKITVNGLMPSNTDLLLQLIFLDNTSQTRLITPEINSYMIPARESSFEVAKTYTYLGVEHILEGFDHLLFVFALLLIVPNIRQLVLTITAFTIAHSITLVGVTFGYLSLPGPPVEAVIALSIIFLAMEVIHKNNGIEGVTARFPWIVSFTFGLLHGFGFAGALSEIGLPEHAQPLALLFFNVGVEIGQLIFVSVIIFIGFMIKKLNMPKLIYGGRILITYAIGSMASFWFIERVSGF